MISFLDSRNYVKYKPEERNLTRILVMNTVAVKRTIWCFKKFYERS